MEKERLEQLVNIKTGKLNANASDENGVYPFFTCSKETLRINKYSYDCECVLVAGNGDLNAKYYNGKFDAYQRTYILTNKDKDKLNLKYLYYFMQNYVETLRNQSIGGVIKYIKLENLTEAKINLVSLERQEEIINTLQKAEEIINERKRQIENLQILVKSQFVEMFGTPLKNEKQYLVCSAEEICLKITDGSHYSPRNQDKGYPMLSVKDMRNDGFHYENCKHISEEDFKRMQKLDCIPRIDDVLISKDGSYFYYGFVVEKEKEEAILSSIAMLRPNIKIINPYYLRYYMLSPEIIDLVSKNYVTGAALKRVILKGIKQIPVTIPNINDQNKFAKFVKQIDKQKFEELKSEKLLKNLIDEGAKNV